MTTDYAMLARPSADLSWGLLAPGEASPRCFSWFYCWRIGNVDSGMRTSEHVQSVRTAKFSQLNEAILA